MALAALLASACTVELPGGKNAPSSGRSSDTSLKSIFINDDKYDEIREEYEVESTVKTVRVSATPADEGAQLAVVPSGAISISEGVTKKFTITVAAEDGTEKFYPILVRRAQDTSDGTALSYITVNGERIYVNGTEISYEVPSSTEEVLVAAVPKLSTSTVTFITGDSGQIDRGGMAVFRIKVTASDETEKTYTLTVKRPASLSSNTSLSSVVLLDVEGSIVAQVGTISTSMSCDVPAETEQVSVSARAESGGATVSVSPSSLTPVGTSGAVFTITVEAENGAVGTYTLTVRQAAPIDSDTSLSDILVNGVSIGASSTEWSVAASVEKVSVIANPKSEGASASVSPAGEQSVAPGASITFTITVTAADKTTEAYKLTVKRPSDASEADLSLASLTVNGEAVFVSGGGVEFSKNILGSGDSESVTVRAAADPNATVTVEPAGVQTISAGTSKTFTITVSKGDVSKIYTLVVGYTKQSGEANTETFTTEYYATNPNGQVGTYKKVSNVSDWTEADIVAQGVACDTARSWRGGHEYPDPDLYALFAAWDDTNLYLMVEIPNVDDADALDADRCFAGSQFLPMGWAIKTGKRAVGNGLVDEGGNVWQNGKTFYSYKSGIDTLIMHHPRLNIGDPSIFFTKSDGLFSYDKDYCKGIDSVGIVRTVSFNQSVSSHIYAAVTDSEGNWGDKASTDMTTYTYMDYKAKKGTKMTAYQLTIPFETLGITRAYLESTGIGISVFSTYGASMMDCLPWDPCMVDNAGEAYSSDQSSSREKEDVDDITMALAAVGNINTSNR